MAGTGSREADERVPRTAWAFLTNHANVLLCIARDTDIRLRDVSAKVGITERATQSIVADLVEAGYVTRKRVGRRNRYEVHLDGPLRDPLASDQSIGAVLRALTAGDGRVAGAAAG